MRIVGIDYSSRSIDIVTVPRDPDDGGPAAWHGYPLEGADAFDRTRQVAEQLPGRASLWWDGILACAIEHPAGRVGVPAMMRVQGAVLSQLPARMLVVPLPPARWKQLAGLPGSASHERYVEHSLRLLEQEPYGGSCRNWPEDAHAAHLMAVALRVMLEREELAA